MGRAKRLRKLKRANKRAKARDRCVKFRATHLMGRFLREYPNLKAVQAEIIEKFITSKGPLHIVWDKGTGKTALQDTCCDPVAVSMVMHNERDRLTDAMMKICAPQNIKPVIFSQLQEEIVYEVPGADKKKLEGIMLEIQNTKIHQVPVLEIKEFDYLSPVDNTSDFFKKPQSYKDKKYF